MRSYMPSLIRPHPVEVAWYPNRRRWCCSTCMRRVQFGYGGGGRWNVPFHRWWWRWWG